MIWSEPDDPEASNEGHMPTFHDFSNLDGWSASVRAAQSVAMGPLEFLTHAQQLADIRQQSTIRQGTYEQQQKQWGERNQEYADANAAATAAGTTLGGFKFATEQANLEGKRLSNTHMGYLNTEAATKIAEDAASNSFDSLSESAKISKMLLSQLDTSISDGSSIDNPLEPPQFLRNPSAQPSFFQSAASEIDNIMSGVKPNIDAGRAKVLQTQMQNILHNTLSAYQMKAATEKAHFDMQDKLSDNRRLDLQAGAQADYWKAQAANAQDKNDVAFMQALNQANKNSMGAKPPAAINKNAFVQSGVALMVKDRLPQTEAYQTWAKSWNKLAHLGADPTVDDFLNDHRALNSQIEATHEAMGGSEGITAFINNPNVSPQQRQMVASIMGETNDQAIQRQLAPATQPGIPNAYEQAKAAAAQSINEQVGADPVNGPELAALRLPDAMVRGYMVPKLRNTIVAVQQAPPSQRPAIVGEYLSDWNKFVQDMSGGQIDANDNQVRGYYLPLDGVGVQFFRDKPTANTAESLDLARRLQPVSMSAFTNNLRTQLMTGSPTQEDQRALYQQMNVLLSRGMKSNFDVVQQRAGRLPTPAEQAAQQGGIISRFSSWVSRLAGQKRDIQSPEFGSGRDVPKPKKVGPFISGGRNSVEDVQLDPNQ